ncbi:MAG: phenylalanine--tRNA ligase subunit beta [Candidatus Moranbacteria bacterium]|nr:phenylalanine--tRNA ligase subunit beta [Candidatus Moranbacteria bacterium]
MKYSYHWLKELSGTKKSADALAKLLMTHAFEVEGIEKCSLVPASVIVGKVVKLERHKNADTLRVARVECGKKDTRTIVCGAPNIALEQKVAVAMPGTVLPGGVEIKEATIRGVVSKGMICSAKELGLGDDHSGILVLPEHTPVGALFGKYFGLDDSLIEVKILPDRGSDALSYQGLAREIAALDGHAPHFVKVIPKIAKVPSYNRCPKIKVTYKNGCRRYMGMLFSDISVGESPLWLKIKLLLSGLRPINSVVDVTNYLMLLTGQPMHAFDADTLHGGVTVRPAKKKEKLMLLNGVTYILSPDDMVIADEKRALALAGIMGGSTSSVTEKTKNVFLEIAHFHGPTIRRTRTRHALLTDASYRFERNLDPHRVKEVAREAALLMTTINAGKMMGMRDVYPKEQKEWKITLSLQRIEDVLGEKVPLFEAVQYLALLGLGVKKVSGKNALDVTVPTRRPDLMDEWDLIEEIGRMRGYEKIKACPPFLPLVAGEENQSKRFERFLKETLVASGFDEVMTYSFYGEKEYSLARLPKERHCELENPMSPEQRFLRLSLLPGLLRKTRDNLRYFDALDCFEYESVFSRGAKKGSIEEKKKLSLVTVLPKKNKEQSPFFVLKGKIQSLRALLDISDISFVLPEEQSEKSAIQDMLHPTRRALLVIEGDVVGMIGELHPFVAQGFGLDSRVAVAELDYEKLFAHRLKEAFYVPLQKFPYALRDLSLTFPASFRKRVTVAIVEKFLLDVGAPLLRRVELFDIYEHDDEKSMAFHLSFGAADRTIMSEEMDRAFDAIVMEAKERFEARLRL